MIKILVVDDDRLLADLVSFAFRRKGYEVIQAHDGRTALLRWEAEKPDLIVLDVNLPEQDGYAVCRQVRAQANTPIIMLTVRSEEDDIVHGLEIGADDYLPKPFSPRQLVARAEATLRRAHPGLAQAAAATPRRLGDIVHHPSRREVRIGQGKPIYLAPLESKLLQYLMLHAGTALMTGAIIDHIWGVAGGDSDMVRQLVYRLRAKLEPDPAKPRYIKNVPRMGYVFLINLEDQ